MHIKHKNRHNISEEKIYIYDQMKFFLIKFKKEVLIMIIILTIIVNIISSYIYDFLNKDKFI